MMGGYGRETVFFAPRGAVGDLRLDFRIAGLVLRAVPQTFDNLLAVVLAAMTLLASIAAMIAVAVSVFLFAGIGMLVLRACKVQMDGKLERMLFGLGAGVVVFVLLVTLGELSSNTRTGVRIAVAAGAALGLFGAGHVARVCWFVYQAFLDLLFAERLVAYTIAVVLALEGFAAVAPLIGSDALHYHFAAQANWLREGLHPQFFLSHSFFSGMNHQLILAGLALGSEKLALGWIFLGGAAAAFAVIQLTRLWVGNGIWPWIAALAFLLSRVVLWQAAGSGAPDIWMTFFVVLGVLAILRARESASWGAVVLAGLFVGMVAGGKYTGLSLAALLGVMFLLEVRSLKFIVTFGFAAIVAGCWPYLRNWFWSGDALFPFLMTRLHPERLNAFTLASYRGDTGAAGHYGLWQVLKFPLFAGMDPAHNGLWHMFGPLVLCLAPLTFCAIRNTPLWRIVIGVWVPGALLIGANSGMTRFLLPLYGVALASSIAGAALCRPDWRAARVAARWSITAELALGFVGLCLYDFEPWRASAGLVSREEYLRDNSPDYTRQEFVYAQLAGKEREGKALVFFRHVYYLRVPNLHGNPDSSWAIDPAKLQANEAWLQLFHENRIRWVVKDEQYPSPIRAPLMRLEAQGVLIPCASQSIEIREGNVIRAEPEKELITLLCLKQ
jgi:hypothetical protein